jgi:probable DNA metabolism protein
MISVSFQPSFDWWFKCALELLTAHRAPAEILWIDATQEQGSLPGMMDGEPLTPSRSSHKSALVAPGHFVELARRVAAHQDDNKWRLLYSLLYRLTYENPRLLHIEVDQEVSRLLQMDKQVRRDAHKMKAFVRFRRVTDEHSDCYIAWHRPDHDVLPLVAPFFVERFAAMTWSILTPNRSAHWDRTFLRYGEGIPQSQAPQADELEDLWRTYYAAIFNPARVKVKAMRAEMPTRYWRTLPETRVIPDLLATARSRTLTMVASQQGTPSATPFVPIDAPLPELRMAAADCTGCPLHRSATQTVFGQGPDRARIVVIGEQPGDQEDVQGTPFVGPAGDILNRALAEAGLKRQALYVTNAVKHFKFIVEGKRRRHQTPKHSEVVACRPWLEAELAVLRPDTIVCLGATAAKSLFGVQFRLMQQRGEWLSTAWTSHTLVTLHPSAILRATDESARDRLYKLLVDDLTKVATRHDERTADLPK